MKHVAQSRIIVFKPYPHRGEQCAIGLLVWLPGGEVLAYPVASLRKAKAIDPSCDMGQLRAGLHGMADELTKHPSALSLYQSGVGAIRVQEQAGTLRFSTEQELRDAIAWALAVAAEPAKPDLMRQRVSVSRLFVDIKNAFSAYGWIASIKETINDHKIIPRYPLARAEGLTVDFALRNGALHCMQTMDFRAAPESKRQEATAKLLTLAYAPQISGDDTRGYAIIAGSGAPEAAAAIKLAERIPGDIFFAESSADMGRLFDAMTKAMGRPPLPQLSTL